MSEYRWRKGQCQEIDDVLSLRKFVDLPDVAISQRSLGNAAANLRREKVDVIRKYDRSGRQLGTWDKKEILLT